MTKALGTQSGLMLGCASAALAVGLVLGPTPAAAQGIQADGQVVSGSGGIFNTGPNQTSIFLDAPVTVIDWTPRETPQGDALTFLPQGSTALFTSPQSPNFAVLNRILPSTNGNQVVINGSVIGQVQSAAGGPTAGGFIAFYSPTGILIGGTATFDVGRLLLTTLDTTATNFGLFVQQGGTLGLNGLAGSTARIEIQQNARITATPENAFFAVVAADIEMRGTARINGSQAYVAGEVVGLGFSNGLFSINVPVGTAAGGEVVTLNGNVGGPSSTGAAGDNHVIYAVAVPQNDPISMLFRGNLGFDPAQTAGVVNGEIILAANYDVFERFVDGGLANSGNAAVFDANSQLTPTSASILIEDAAVSSNLLAIASDRTELRANNANATALGSLQLIGRGTALLTGNTGRTITINGDVLLSASDYGVTTSSTQSLDEFSAQAGTARLEAFTGATVTVSGDLAVTADAFGGQSFFANIPLAGSATGGSATVAASGGRLNLRGSVDASARGVVDSASEQDVDSVATGGLARVLASSGGIIDITDNLTIRADALSPNPVPNDPSFVSDALGGQALLQITGSGGGTITVQGNAALFGGAVAQTSINTTTGALADAGEARVTIIGGGTIDVAGQLDLQAVGQGGDNEGGRGGTGRGGRADIEVRDGGTVTVDGNFTANARGLGGAGRSGGDAFGGIAGAIVRTGRIEIGGVARADSGTVGGAASFGFGGAGGLGRGGYSVLQADGTLTQTATLTVTGAAQVDANGVGGRGGNADGQQGTPAGRGGDGIGGQSSVPNQASPALTSGSFVLAGGDNGRISIGGLLETSASGIGGVGGRASGQLGPGRGGDGFGGQTQVGLALLGLNGSVGLGTAGFAQVIAAADGIGGQSGLSLVDVADGTGGNGTGGSAILSVHAGDATVGTISLQAIGLGGNGRAAGSGTGGTAGLQASLGGLLRLDELALLATGDGGLADTGTGGTAQGGRAEVDIAASAITIAGNLTLNSAGQGGSSANGASGSGTGGAAAITTNAAAGTATLNVGGNTRLLATGQGGDSRGGFRAGNGRGGTAVIEARDGGVLTFLSAQAIAAGLGGVGGEHEGGDGSGGTAELRSLGTGSRITIQRNTPNDFLNLLGAGAILSADGIGAVNDGGNGIGGTGTGGAVRMTANGGGSVVLPADPANDPNSFGGAIRLWARGLGGDSNGNGGIGAGGSGTGGTADLVIGGAGSGITMGRTDMSVTGIGGSSPNPLAPNITGGAGVGGTQRIEITNGGTATLTDFTGNAGGTGGDGSGSGSGGNAIAGVSGTTVINSTLNIVSRLGQFSFAGGGDGAVGGNATSTAGEGGGAFLVGENATVTFTTNGGADDGLLLRSDLTGGAGTTDGGNAQGGALRLVLTDSTITGAPGITLRSDTVGGGGTARGGAAQGETINVTMTGTRIAGTGLSAAYRVVGGAATALDGVGGDATGGAVRAGITGSTLSLAGPAEISAVAVGGDGGPGSASRGGNAASGAAGLALSGSSLTLTGQQTPADALRVVSEANGGRGVTAGGTATSNAASLTLAGSRVVAGQVAVTAGAAANVGRGALARAGTATIDISGASTLTAESLFINAIGNTSEGQASIGGAASLFIRPGSTASVNAAGLFVEAVGLSEGTQPSPNVIGQFVIDVQGGNLNLGRLSTTGGANGLPVSDNVPASQLVAAGGNINVTGELFVSAGGDLVVRSGAGGIIGSAATAGTTTAVSLFVDGTIDVRGDGGASGGIGGQSVLMEAGRSLLIDSNVSTRDGPVTLTANIGRLRAETQPPLSVVTMGPGGRIDAGTGTVTIRLLDGAGDPQRTTGAITLGRITAARIDVRNLGSSAGSDIAVRADGVLTASGTGRAIDLASLNGEVINRAGDAGLILTGGGHYGIFAATPTGSQIGSFANYARRYAVPNAAAYDQLNPGGNFAAFRITPVLTISAADAARLYGNPNPALGLSIAGFLPGDGPGDLSGAAQLATSATTTSNVGAYAITVGLGTLQSVQGYQIALGNPGVLTVTPRPITVTANNLSRVYGNPNPALTFAVGGQGLVNGDQLTGALASAAGATTGVGSAAITQGTLAASANYALTFAPGVLTITPRPLTVAADNLTKLAGLPDPALTFTLGGDGLVNGDRLTGSLVRDPGETIGPFAIRQGTLSAGANYAVTFIGGTLTITSPPAPPELTSPILFEPPLMIGAGPPPVSGMVNMRFGIDFPDQVDAPLITEDPLLDDPVSSGGDPSVYGSSGGTGDSPSAGGQ